MSKDSTSAILKNYITLGITFALTLVAIILNRGEIEQIIKNDLLHAILSLLLSIVTLMWLIFWIIFGRSEIDLLEEYIKVGKSDEYESSILASTLPIAIGLLFGLLFAFTINIYVYLPIILSIHLFSFYGDTRVTKMISKNLFKYYLENSSAHPLQQKIREQIFHYYFQNNYFFREGITIAILSIAWYVSSLKFNFDVLTPLHFGYILTIISILFNELLIWKWRRIRSKIIRELEEEYELQTASVKPS